MGVEQEPNEVREAIKKFLSEDSILQEISDGVFFELAPESPYAEYPIVVIGRPAGMDEWDFGGGSMQDDAWTIKGVSDEPSEAEAIDKRCHKLLNAEELTIKNRELLLLMSQTVVDYMETVDGERYQHTGHVYKIVSEERND